LVALGERDDLVPSVVPVDGSADDEDRAFATIERRAGFLESRGIRSQRMRNPVCRERLGELIPIVDGNRHERRPAWWLHREVISARDRGRHVLRARGLVAPLHVGLRQLRGLCGEQKRLVGQDRARLLPRGDHERRAVLERREDIAHRVADTGRGVQIDQRGIARRLRVAVGHADDDRFLQPEHVAKVVGEVAEHR
jgi:hypothetical protein